MMSINLRCYMNTSSINLENTQEDVVSGLSARDIRIFTKDIPSMQLAMERGSVAMVNSKLYDLPAFIPWAMSAGEAQKTAVLRAIEWLKSAQAYEAVHGEESKWDSNHPLNIKIDASLARLHEQNKLRAAEGKCNYGHVIK